MPRNPEYAHYLNLAVEEQAKAQLAELAGSGSAVADNYKRRADGFRQLAKESLVTASARPRADRRFSTLATPDDWQLAFSNPAFWGENGNDDDVTEECDATDALMRGWLSDPRLGWAA